MTRIGHIADVHFDFSSRWEECLRITGWIADDVAARVVDLITIGGDLFERRPLPIETKAAAEWIIALAEQAPVVIVAGNHDVTDSLAVMGRLEAEHGIYIYDRPGVRELAGVAIACLPWPTKAGVLSSLPDGGKDAGEQAAGDALRVILRGLGALIADHDGPRILLAHAMIRGSRTSTGQPLCGMEFELGLEDLGMVEADAYLLGHIHMPQSWEVNGAPVIYPGSPRRTAFGEVEDKGYVILDCKGLRGDRVSWTPVTTPCTPMLLLESTWTPDGFLSPWIEYVAPDGAEIRWRYEVASDMRDAARSAAAVTTAELKAAGAITVKVEEVVTPTTRARVPEIAVVQSLPEKLDALWRCQNYDPRDRRQALLAKVAELEKEVANA